MAGLSLRRVFISLLAFAVVLGCKENDALRYYGNFEARELMLPAGGSGEIVSMLVSEGGECDSADVVAVVDTSILVLERERIASAIDALRYSLPDIDSRLSVILEKREALERELAKIEQLVLSGSASDKMADGVRDNIALANKEHDAAKSALLKENSSVLAQIGAMEAQLKIVQQRIEKCYLRAPFHARILEVNIMEGEYVAEGSPVMVLTRWGTLDFVAWVPGNHLFAISPGDSVTLFYDIYGGKTDSCRGRVFHVSERPQFIPSMVQTRENRWEQHYKVKVILNNMGAIKPGMPGELVP